MLLDRSQSDTSVTQLLREVGRKSPRSGKRLHAASWFGLICAITAVVLNAVGAVEDGHRGEAYGVRIISAGSEAPGWDRAVAALTIPGQAVSST